MEVNVHHAFWNFSHLFIPYIKGCAVKPFNNTPQATRCGHHIDGFYTLTINLFGDLIDLSARAVELCCCGPESPGKTESASLKEAAAPQFSSSVKLVEKRKRTGDNLAVVSDPALALEAAWRTFG
ncbi:Hypothetical predicted protein [Podarcis lilfordi]|uniref:Uncharacterized protein n=1 Tax=Podarcis lilfordi TaxID=74358 RepID=A0AA35KX33_9SAUR|nr:Hypothetical predicted protein [Podarcis lilfordi]